MTSRMVGGDGVCHECVGGAGAIGVPGVLRQDSGLPPGNQAAWGSGRSLRIGRDWFDRLPAGPAGYSTMSCAAGAREHSLFWIFVLGAHCQI